MELWPKGYRKSASRNWKKSDGTLVRLRRCLAFEFEYPRRGKLMQMRSNMQIRSDEASRGCQIQANWDARVESYH